MKTFLKFFAGLIFIALLVQFSSINVYPGWFRHYGGTQDDDAFSIQQTSDGGYIVAGTTLSYTYGVEDIAVYKLDSNGNKVWFKHYGGTDADHGYSIQQTSDGGYIVSGKTDSFTNGDYDVAIYKLNSSGNKVWFKNYGGINSDYAYSIQQTSEGGYIVVGTTESFTHGQVDFAIYKLDSDGNKVWFKNYGGLEYEYGYSIQQTSDGGYIVSGQTSSFTYGGADFAIYKLNSSGNKTWVTHKGGTESDYSISIQLTSDGEYIVAGHTISYTHGGFDFAIYKLDSYGDKVWFKHYGGIANEGAYSIQQTSDGGYIVAGYTSSYTHGDNDFAIYKLNSSGGKVWFRYYGGAQDDYAYSIQQTSDGGYIVAGRTESYTYGLKDIAIYKLDSNGDK